MPIQAEEKMDCGLVSIDIVLAGPRHGSNARGRSQSRLTC